MDTRKLKSMHRSSHSINYLVWNGCGVDDMRVQMNRLQVREGKQLDVDPVSIDNVKILT